VLPNRTGRMDYRLKDVILTVNAKRGTPFWWTGPMSASEANGS